MQRAFDELIGRMFKLVEGQLERLQITHLMENIVEYGSHFH